MTTATGPAAPPPRGAGRRGHGENDELTWSPSSVLHPAPGGSARGRASATVPRHRGCRGPQDAARVDSATRARRAAQRGAGGPRASAGRAGTRNCSRAGRAPSPMPSPVHRGVGPPVQRLGVDRVVREEAQPDTRSRSLQVGVAHSEGFHERIPDARVGAERGVPRRCSPEATGRGRSASMRINSWPPWGASTSLARVATSRRAAIWQRSSSRPHGPGCH